jgi:hypothetical protein
MRLDRVRTFWVFGVVLAAFVAVSTRHVDALDTCSSVGIPLATVRLLFCIILDTIRLVSSLNSSGEFAPRKRHFAVLGCSMHFLTLLITAQTQIDGSVAERDILFLNGADGTPKKVLPNRNSNVGQLQCLIQNAFLDYVYADERSIVRNSSEPNPKLSFAHLYLQFQTHLLANVVSYIC